MPIASEWQRQGFNGTVRGGADWLRRQPPCGTRRRSPPGTASPGRGAGRDPPRPSLSAALAGLRGGARKGCWVARARLPAAPAAGGPGGDGGAWRLGFGAGRGPGAGAGARGRGAGFLGPRRFPACSAAGPRPRPRPDFAIGGTVAGCAPEPQPEVGEPCLAGRAAASRGGGLRGLGTRPGSRGEGRPAPQLCSRRGAARPKLGKGVGAAPRSAPGPVQRVPGGLGVPPSQGQSGRPGWTSTGKRVGSWICFVLVGPEPEGKGESKGERKRRREIGKLTFQKHKETPRRLQGRTANTRSEKHTQLTRTEKHT